MSTEYMRKLIQLTEGLDDNFIDDYCRTCSGWGEILPPDVEQDMDNIIPCPDCGPGDEYAPRLKTKDIKDRAFAMDESEGETCLYCGGPHHADDCDTYDGLDDDAEEISEWEVEDFPVSEARYDPQEEVSGVCRWWRDCENEATTTEPHPILGEVPICDRCVAKLRKIEGLDEDDSQTSCGVCGEKFKWVGNPDEEMCPRCTDEYLGEDETDGKHVPYPESWEEKFHRIAADQHEHDLYNVCADDEMNAALQGELEEESCPCGREDCTCGPDCDCEPVGESGDNLDWGVGDYVVPAWEDSGEWGTPLEVIGVRDDQVLVQDDFGNKEYMFPEDLRKAPVTEEDEVKGVNDKYDDETLNCKHCGDYFCTSKFGGECPEIQTDMFAEDISLESIVESVLQEYEGQPKDYVDDEEFEREQAERAVHIQDQAKEFERDKIDPEIEDEELGLRFD